MSVNIWQSPRLISILKRMADVSRTPYWDRYIVIKDHPAHAIVRRAQSEQEYLRYTERQG